MSFDKHSSSSYLNMFILNMFVPRAQRNFVEHDSSSYIALPWDYILNRRRFLSN
ncbi:hypothetical protein GIB67_008210 [Kingdonia uniflora]|uniref:Uncharacterized protein n=1 Tax=Kingdonia uniflora TaxID=39325 RepID=A0A7J7N4E9_9MAGN|nr:hypothetical protein GIB67_008210 [Kingdonia uniflora]